MTGHEQTPEPPQGWDIPQEANEAFVPLEVDPSGTVQDARPVFGPGSAFEFEFAGDAMDRPPLPWIIRGVLPRVGMTMIYADPKTGKSLVALDIAAVVIAGFRFMGEIQAEAVDYVVYMSGEGRSGMGGRLHGLTKAHPDLDREDLRSRLILAGRVVKLGNESGDLSVEEFGLWVERLRGTLPPRADGTPARVVFILDTWANAAQGIDSNDFGAVGDALNRLNELAQTAGIAVVVIHHSNKGGGFMGSQGFYASVDLMFEVKKTEDGGTLSLVGGKDSGGFTPRGYRITIEDVDYAGREGEPFTTSAAWLAWTGGAESDTKPSNKTEQVYERALAYLRDNAIRSTKEGIEFADLMNGIAAPESTLRDALKSAKKRADERIRESKDPRARTEGGRSVMRKVPVYFSPFLGEE